MDRKAKPENQISSVQTVLFQASRELYDSDSPETRPPTETNVQLTHHFKTTTLTT